MIKLNIIAVGRIKESFFREAADEYLKRLSKTAAVNIIEIEEHKLTKESPAGIRTAVETEGARIIPKLEGYVIPLCIEGRNIDSTELSRKIQAVKQEHSVISFVIGGSYGLADAVKERASMSLSFGKMTYPHQLMRVILLEQIYRALSIEAGSPYHK